MLQSMQLTRDHQRWRLALRYALGAGLFALAAFALGGGGLWLFWPAAALLLVVLNYALFGASGFQKAPDGHLSSAAHWLLAPYLAAAWINSRLWTRKHPQPDQIVDGVWLGRVPTGAELRYSSFKAVLDVCAELPLAPGTRAYYSVPVLDLSVPTTAQCLELAQALERLHQQGPVLVCCALGYSRSATAIAAWLLHSGRATSVEAAIAMLQQARPRIVLHATHRQALAPLSKNLRGLNEH